MDLTAFAYDPLAPDDGRQPPIGFVDLASLPDTAVPWVPPPFPVVARGDPTHTLADLFDAVVMPPVSAASLIAGASAMPDAAAIAVQLLRMTERSAIDAALMAESMVYGLLQGSAGHAAWCARRPPPPAMPAGELHVARDGDALHLLIDRPAAHNAIDRHLRDALHEGFMLAALDPAIELVRLRATGRSFSVGGDLAEFGTTRDPATAHRIRTRTLPAMALARRTARLEVHVQGACIGAGLEIAAFADRLVATPDAWFQLPELAMGLIPGAGGCVSVPRRIGRQRAALMILSGRRINAATALRWGLIDAIEHLPPGDEGGAHMV